MNKEEKEGFLILAQILLNISDEKLEKKVMNDGKTK